MSVYQLNKLCHRMLRDFDFRAAMQRDPAAAIAPYELNEQERELLVQLLTAERGETSTEIHHAMDGNTRAVRTLERRPSYDAIARSRMGMSPRAERARGSNR